MFALFCGGVCLTSRASTEVEDMIINCFKITVTGGLGLLLLVFNIVACFNYSSKAQADVERACFGTNTRVILD